MSKITPCLWFDDKAEEAANFYVSAFRACGQEAEIGEVSHYGEGGPMPAGTVLTVSFTLAGQEFVALNGGPHFTFSPAVSMSVGCADQGEVDQPVHQGRVDLLDLVLIGARQVAGRFQHVRPTQLDAVDHGLDRIVLLRRVLGRVLGQGRQRAAEQQGKDGRAGRRRCPGAVESHETSFDGGQAATAGALTTPVRRSILHRGETGTRPQ